MRTTQKRVQHPPFIPPEFQEYEAWMQKNKYSKYMIDSHIQNAKRVGYLLCNSDKDVRYIAELVTPNKNGQDKVANTLNDYRYFAAEKFMWENRIDILKTITDKVLV